MLRLFRPQIEALLLRREAMLGTWQGKHPDRDPLLDEELEVTSSVRIDIDRQVARSHPTSGQMPTLLLACADACLPPSPAQPARHD